MYAILSTVGVVVYIGVGTCLPSLQDRLSQLAHSSGVVPVGGVEEAVPLSLKERIESGQPLPQATITPPSPIDKGEDKLVRSILAYVIYDMKPELFVELRWWKWWGKMRIPRQDCLGCHLSKDLYWIVMRRSSRSWWRKKDWVVKIELTIVGLV